VAVKDFPKETLLNINLPAISGSDVKGVKVTHLGSRVFSEEIALMKDPWGKEIYWIGGGRITWTGGADSDFRATSDGYISVTPLRGTERVLEIGTGSAYPPALLGALAATVFSVERVQALAVAAQRALREALVTNVSVLLGDGTLGWSAYAPYDAILVTAGGPDVPPPLVAQLAPGGRLLIPLGVRGAQTLTLIERVGAGDALRHTPLG